MSIQAVAWALEQALPPRAKLILISLANHADHVDGYCWLRAETIAREGACDVRSVPRFIKGLIEHGYVRRQARHGDDGRQRASDYWLLFNENKIPWMVKPRSDKRQDDEESEDAETTTYGVTPDSQSPTRNDAIRPKMHPDSLKESGGPTDSQGLYKNIEEPSKSNLGDTRPRPSPPRSYEPKIQPLADGWYDRRSREARAIGVLCHIVGQEHYFYDVMGGQETIRYQPEITPQLMVLATAPPRSEWAVINEQRQVAAWFNFAVEYLPMLRIKLRGPCKVPWPWPPRKAGVPNDGRPANALEDEGIAEIKANVA
jgi:hypothetical protein